MRWASRSMLRRIISRTWRRDGAVAGSASIDVTVASTGVSGVRSSWLSVARKRSLARLAASASTRAAWTRIILARSCSARFSSVMSRSTSTQPAAPSWWLKRETRASNTENSSGPGRSISKLASLSGPSSVNRPASAGHPSNAPAASTPRSFRSERPISLRAAGFKATMRREASITTTGSLMSSTAAAQATGVRSRRRSQASAGTKVSPVTANDIETRSTGMKPNIPLMSMTSTTQGKSTPKSIKAAWAR